MNVDRTTLLFFDASCLVAASRSPTGGSGFLLRLCALEFLEGAVSQAVLLEAERNISRKFPLMVLTTYDQLLARIPLAIAPLPTAAQRQRYRGLVSEKDEHVVASAVAVGAPYLLTLDQPLIRQVNQAKLPVQAFSPAEFIKTVLPQHVDYPPEE